MDPERAVLHGVMDCEAAKKGVLAPGRRKTGPDPQPSTTEDAANFLRTDHALDIANDC